MSAAPTIPHAIPNLEGNEARYLGACISSGFVSSVGPFVPRFESMLADCAGAVGAVTTCSGTSALHLALVVAGVRRDDLVIVPDITFIATANAVSQCGAEPWIFDIEPAGWTLDADAVAQALETLTTPDPVDGRPIQKATGRRVGAILVVHVLGAPADMDRLAQIAARYRLPLLADGAAALGATYRERPLAAMGAALTALSFNGNKTITTGSGGALVGLDGALLDRARHLGSTARTGAEYDHDARAFNYRMSNLEAAVGCAQLERLALFLTAKRRIRARYNAAFADLPEVAGFPPCPWGQGADWLSGVVLPPGWAQGIGAQLRAQGIDARSFWKPLHMQAPYRTAPRDRLRQSAAIWDRVLTLPSSAMLGEEDQERVIGALRAAVSARAVEW